MTDDISHIQHPGCSEFGILESALRNPIVTSQDMGGRLEAMDLCMKKCGMVQKRCALLVEMRQ